MTAYLSFISKMMRKSYQKFSKDVFRTFLADVEKSEIGKFSVFSFSGGFLWGCSRSHYFLLRKHVFSRYPVSVIYVSGPFYFFFFSLLFPSVLAFRLLLRSLAAQDLFEYFFPALIQYETI